MLNADEFDKIAPEERLPFKPFPTDKIPVAQFLDQDGDRLLIAPVSDEDRQVYLVGLSINGSDVALTPTQAVELSSFLKDAAVAAAMGNIATGAGMILDFEADTAPYTVLDPESV